MSEKKTSPTHDVLTEACNEIARERLLNRQIVEVRYLTREECDQLMWSKTGVGLVLDDGTCVYAACDDEGNDAGALHGISGEGEEFVIPEVNV